MGYTNEAFTPGVGSLGAWQIRLAYMDPRAMVLKNHRSMIDSLIGIL
jgi:hypothetical protein